MRCEGGVALLKYSAPAPPPLQQSTFYSRFNGTDLMEDWTPTNTRYAPAPISVVEHMIVSILS